MVSYDVAHLRPCGTCGGELIRPMNINTSLDADRFQPSTNLPLAARLHISNHLDFTHTLLNSFTLRVPLESIVCLYHIFANNFGI